MPSFISRQDAKSRGLKRYFTGKPCKYEHIVERSVSSGMCRECHREQSRQWSAIPEHKEQARKRSEIWRTKLENKEREKAYKAKPAYKEKVRKKSLARYRKPENIAFRATIEFKKRQTTRHALRIKQDAQYHLATVLRARLSSAIKSGSCKGSAVHDLGCSISEFQSYIENQFLPGMSWSNYGRKTWHLDHIIPLSKFDLTNREQFLCACNYTNYQPLWAVHNLQKGNRLNWSPL